MAKIKLVELFIIDLRTKDSDPQNDEKSDTAWFRINVYPFRHHN